MDDLTHYIFNNYYGLLTLYETAAHRCIMREEKAENSDAPEMRAMLRRGWMFSDPNVQGLLREGTEQFVMNVRDRVLKEEADKVFLNHCPRCGTLALTPQAKQCPQCFYSWHGTS